MSLTGNGVLPQLEADRAAAAGAARDISREADSFTRARDYLRHVRASRARAGLPLSWRDSEQALWSHVLTLRALAAKVPA